MPTPTKGPRLGGSPAHQRLILSNLATSLFEHGRITTTEAKARRLRPYAEHLISKSRVDSVANRRQVVKVIRDRGVLHTLFTEIGPRFATRPGGYTRITKLGPRKGDNAPMAMIELVEEQEFTATTGTTAGRATTGAPTPTVAADETEPETEGTAAPETTTPAPDPDAEAPADETDAVVEEDAREEEIEAETKAGTA